MSSGTGTSVSPVASWTSASWRASPAPLFRVISSRKCRNSAVCASSYVLVWKRSPKDSPERVSSVCQVSPSAEPFSVQSFGSRSSWSLAEVSAYLAIFCGASRSNSTQPVGAKVSHLVPGSLSTRFSFTSPPPVFSALARTPVTFSVTLPGMPVLNPPSTPEARLPPSAPVSTVSVQSGAGSPASKEDANSRSAFAGAPGRATAAP